MIRNRIVHVRFIPLLVVLVFSMAGCGPTEAVDGSSSAWTLAAAPTSTALPPIRMEDFREADENCEDIAGESSARGGVMLVTRVEQSSSYCGPNHCTVHFSDSRGTTRSIFVYVGTGNNAMNRLGSGFSQEDVVIRSDDGSTVKIGDSLDMVFGCSFNPKNESPCDYYARRLIHK